MARQRLARVSAEFEITIKVRIEPGSDARPRFRVLGGDTLFLNLPPGHSVSWKIKRVKKGA